MRRAHIPPSPWLQEAAEEVYTLLQLWHRSITSQPSGAEMESCPVEVPAPEGLMTYLVSSAATSNGTTTIDYVPSKEAVSLWDDLLSLRDRIV